MSTEPFFLPFIDRVSIFASLVNNLFHQTFAPLIGLFFTRVTTTLLRLSKSFSSHSTPPSKSSSISTPNASWPETMGLPWSLTAKDRDSPSTDTLTIFALVSTGIHALTVTSSPVCDHEYPSNSPPFSEKDFPRKFIAFSSGFRFFVEIGWDLEGAGFDGGQLTLISPDPGIVTLDGLSKAVTCGRRLSGDSSSDKSATSLSHLE
mmetsp:Transcript_751/g.1060  ORF Transcript_751/g.1060 Transcript_751/m.1060 type:complete len:205 (+) Transcript_751:280-894(+)